MSAKEPHRPKQGVHFDSVEELLDWLPEDEARVAAFLRRLVLDSAPGIEEKLSYNVPFYRIHKMLFFIWPGSVDWDGFTHAGVRFGFQYGNLLADEAGYLDRGNRKQVYWRDFLRREDIDVDLLQSYIYEAIAIDAQSRRRKR